MLQRPGPCTLNPSWITTIPSKNTVARQSFRRIRVLKASAGPSSGADPSQNGGEGDGRPLPWSIRSISRERELEWTNVEKARLILLTAKIQLGLEMEYLEARWDQILMLLPDLGAKLVAMKPSVVVELLRDPSRVAVRLVELREALPHANVSLLAANKPDLLLQEGDSIVQDVEAVVRLLGISNSEAQSLVSAHPRFLDTAGVEEVLEELRRLMPKQDACKVLVGDPRWFTRLERGTHRLGFHPWDRPDVQHHYRDDP